MKIVVLDGFTLNPGDNPWSALQELGDVEVFDRTDAEDVLKRSEGAEVIVTNKVVLNAETIASLPELKCIAVSATGYDCVDISAAAERGIPVCNIPGYGTNAVAQFVMALLMELNHRIEIHDQSVKAGEWTSNQDWCYWKSPQIELTGQTMGIIGYGAIGSRVGELAHAFGMKIMASTRSQKPKPDMRHFEWASMEEVFEKADVITLHCPLTSENTEFINAKLLARMKSNAVLINTARGKLVNEADLAEALNTGVIRGAGLDVVSTEPVQPDNPLLKAKNCIVTPHIAWASLTARNNLMRMLVSNVKAYVDGRPSHVVNEKLLAK